MDVKPSVQGMFIGIQYHLITKVEGQRQVHVVSLWVRALNEIGLLVGSITSEDDEIFLTASSESSTTKALSRRCIKTIAIYNSFWEIESEIKVFIKDHDVVSVSKVHRIIGCPHERVSTIPTANRVRSVRFGAAETDS